MKSMRSYAFGMLSAAAWIGIGISFHSIYLVHVILMITMIVVLSSSSFRQNLWSQRKWSVFWVVSLIVFGLHAIYAADHSAAFKHLVILMLGASITITLPAILPSEKSQRTAWLMVLGVVLFECTCAVMETTGWVRWPIGSISSLNPIFGYPDLLERFRDDPQALQFLRYSPTGFHWNPNDCCLALLLPLPFIYLYRRSNWLPIIYSVVLMFIMLMAGARMLMMLTLLILGLMVFFKSFKRRTVLWSLLVNVVMMFAFHQFVNRSQESMKVVGQETDNSSSVRMQLMKRSWELFQQSKGLGIGGGQAQSTIQRDGGFGIHHDTSIHNFWLEWLTEGGVLLALGYLLYFCAICWSLWRQYRSQSDSCALAFLFTMLIVLLGVVSLSSALYFLPMYVIFGWAIAHIQQNRFQPATSS